ncbi:serine/threonine protein kinase domain protein [Metarhizium robertsii]|uniref:non-specific serine/threonine protein kinase n=2 Tax=Metarhizium robertsii TaxID=568076 RepID=E9F842_METRA|nr:G2-specific protein kinase nimA [Metarhizium robertsii ARSEF 23]EFY96134.1 G2-specific protein kinase nimA [Metarhizium robertsii ARSEF 23]EXU98341.1 serine/threonine protein kinase domain protein [Metarhizium robertsii]
MSSEDKYETLEKIGHGSFGVIRKVRRKADGFIMCRKEISYLRMSQKEREQLHTEFQILSHLRHANIVAYYHREHLKASQDLHLYMEYCGNGDLGRVIKDLQHKGQRAQESFVWSIFSQLVMALYRCHYGVDPPEAGANALGLTQGSANGTPKVPAGAMTILHRDLKPENVFLGEDNSVKLGDFGLSKMIKSHDFASTYVGTPFYMSPEICAAEKYTLKSDIWSLGCIIYELCAREPPFNAKTHFQLVQKIKEGKVSTLPEMYSPELNQVIRDCLKVNPDRRPDTVQLLNLPVVKLMRKEKEVVDLNKSLRAKEDLLHRKEKELNERIANLERERQMMREEIDSQLRMEWEVKARLEIDRLANVEIEQLQQRFEGEIQVRVDAELQKLKHSNVVQPEATLPVEDYASAIAKPDIPQSSTGGSGDEFPSTTDPSEYSLDSPEASKEPKRAARTPFGRAQTMFAGHAGTPMDVEMASPSPMAIANLSLSPRRGGATKAPTSHSGNIFAANANKSADPRWDLREPLSIESDDEDIVPSPTRNIRSANNPFTSKNRPVLSSQKSCPLNRLKPQASATGLVSKAVFGPQAEPRPRSPTRQISKIPSMASLPTDTSGGLTRKHSVKKDINGGEALNKMAAKNNIKGRTLVELQQARAGGRPMSAGGGTLENVSPKRAMFKEKVGERRVSGGSGSGSSSSSSGSESVAVWDPEKDEMPSPFLVRQKRIVKV